MSHPDPYELSNLGPIDDISHSNQDKRGCGADGLRERWLRSSPVNKIMSGILKIRNDQGVGLNLPGTHPLILPPFLERLWKLTGGTFFLPRPTGPPPTITMLCASLNLICQVTTHIIHCSASDGKAVRPSHREPVARTSMS